MKKEITTRLGLLQNLILEANIDLYIISDSDPHQSEYLADYWQSRAWLSGFDGSTGTLVVSTHASYLFTDSRYFMQAEKQLAQTPIRLKKVKGSIWQSLINWIKSESNITQIGFNGELFSNHSINLLKKQLPQVSLRSDLELVTQIWWDRPPLPQHPVFERRLDFCGMSPKEKLASIQKEIQHYQAAYYLCTTLDDIAWLLNLRGNDIPHNPVFMAYFLIGHTQSYLFIDDQKLTPTQKVDLQKIDVEIHPYESLGSFLTSTIPTKKQFLVNETTLNQKLATTIPDSLKIKVKNLVGLQKAIKNEQEIMGARTAMVKDGLALTHLFIWLEKKLAQEKITEFEVAQKLIQLRRKQGDYFGESFDAIVGYQANGAIVHYRPNHEESALLQPEGLLLLDSGGQYMEGTTDITRTIALGQPTPQQKKHFTLVLKGHIALAIAQFPVGTTGVQLDTLARNALWRAGLDFGHGTGHGVGSFLNVHEGPQSISPRLTSGSTAIKPGMITSNEPGFYLDHQYGIRIENLILCIEKEQTDFGTFLAFETLTLFPIDQSLLDFDYLDSIEINWLNDYHKKVFAKLSPFLDGEALVWLQNQCGGL